MFQKHNWSVVLLVVGFFVLGFIVGVRYSTGDTDKYRDFEIDIMRNKITILECNKRSNELKDMQRRLDDLMTKREEE